MELRLLSIQWIGRGRQNNLHFLDEENSVSPVSVFSIERVAIETITARTI
jgi:hypothetical protein